jgi:hypothetical protein
LKSPQTRWCVSTARSADAPPSFASRALEMSGGSSTRGVDSTERPPCHPQSSQAVGAVILRGRRAYHTLLAGVFAILAGACSTSKSEAAQAGSAVTIAIVADLRGELEPCGCTGELLGGVDRVVGTVRSLRSRYPNIAVLLVGELVAAEMPESDPTRLQSERKRAAFARALQVLAPDVFVLDASAEASSVQAMVDGMQRTGAGLLLGPLHTGSAIRAFGAHRVGLMRGSDYASEVARGLRAKGADLVIAFAQEPTETSHADVVVGGPSHRASIDISHGVPVVHPGAGGQSVALLRLVPVQVQMRSAAQTWTATIEEIPLDHQAEEAPDVRADIKRVFASFEARNSPEYLADPIASAPLYVGARTCAACHTEAYRWWLGTSHGKAYATLVRRGRQHDLACVPCHVTGLGEPGRPPDPAFLELRSVGCESCHGPGGQHAEYPRIDDSMHNVAAMEARCPDCHDASHSPGFRQDTARAALRARGHGLPMSAK